MSWAVEVGGFQRKLGWRMMVVGHSNDEKKGQKGVDGSERGGQRGL